MSFGHAIEMAKSGNKIARAGWNGSGMFAYIVPAAKYKAQTTNMIEQGFEGDLVPYRDLLGFIHSTKSTYARCECTKWFRIALQMSWMDSTSK